MPRTEWGWLITEEELRGWILFEDDRVLAVNKPAHVVCHPSKHGEWSSLIGACRAYLGKSELHMPTRLDRETSGVVVVVKDAAMRRLLHRAALAGQIHKHYHAVLRGWLLDERRGGSNAFVQELRQALMSVNASLPLANEQRSPRSMTGRWHALHLPWRSWQSQARWR